MNYLTTFITSMNQCKICKSRGDSNKIACDKCDQSVHYKCVNLTPQDINSIVCYFCPDCENKTQLITRWRSRRPLNETELQEKRNLYFEVESILDHKETSDGRQFLAKWKRYNSRHNSWLPERNFDGALDMLQHYLRAHNLPLSRIEGIMGSADDKHLNIDNWISMNILLDKFHKLKNRYLKDLHITIKEWTKFDCEDTLYFLNYESHCFVILYFYEHNHALIADGGNRFRADLATSTDLKEMLKIRLISCAYDQQYKADHCVGSAMIIGLQLLRDYRKGNRPTDIFAPTHLRKTIIASLHKYHSHSLDLPNDTNLKHNKYNCPSCGQRFKDSKRMKCHFTHCPNKDL